VRIANVKLDHFRRFTDLEIKDIPDTVRLVMLAGPNGCGKSSLFDAMNLQYQISAGHGWSSDQKYYAKSTDIRDIQARMKIEMHGGHQLNRGSFYFRSAYRNDPEFSLNSLDRVGPAVDEIRFRRMIDGDAAVTQNYKRLASQAFEDIFSNESPATTVGEFRERVVGNIRDSLKRMFPDLTLNSLGNPLSEGTFRFDKGTASSFEYKNLSGGEKAAFDLLLDVVVKRVSFPEAIYCIDEPEAHMNTRLQGALLQELLHLLPQRSQLWIASHSIGMMRKARELYDASPGTVAFLDFGDHDFDQRVVISPSRPSRILWEKILNVALDDLASLVAPSEVIVCEGNPAGAVPGKNAEHDATCFNTIFADEKPEVKFIAGGNSHDVATDRLGFLSALPALASGIRVRRLIDRDDHAVADCAAFLRQGISALTRRHIECYLYDDEVLTVLCASVGRASDSSNLIVEKQQAIAANVARGRPSDDVKSAAGVIYVKAKQRLGLVGVGNDQMAFARNTLAPLITPGTAIYAALKQDIFGT
jgi:predicted ATPase